MPAVQARGIDYSATEYTPEELNRYSGGFNPEFLGRYIGYPGNTKCISHYPGAYVRHRDAGRPALLFHQIEYRDFEGGYAKGQAHANTALADAKSVGWSGETPIIACFDRRMGAFTRNGVFYREIPLNEVRDYVRGFVSVIGYEHAGFYGFEDTMRPCIEENWVSFTLQCGARSAQIPGISGWQENNYQPYYLRAATDVLELYVPLNELGEDDMAWLDEEALTLENGMKVSWRQLLLSMDKNGSETRDRLKDVEADVEALKTGTPYTLDDIATAVADKIYGRLES